MAINWSSRLMSRQPARFGTRYRPCLEPLEARKLLSTFTVVDLNDGGTGSGLTGDLRYCVNSADNNGGLSNHIVFQPGLTGTISLSQGRLFVDKNLEIDGPGADLLTVSGSGLSGVFEITTDPRAQDVRIAGVTIADGIGLFTTSGPEGGGLFNWHADLTLSNCVFTGNTVGGGSESGRGGAIYSVAGSLVLTNCTITDNHAQGSGPANGGGIYLAGGQLSLNHCTVSGNSAATDGGGLYNLNGVLTATDTTVASNTSGLGAGIEDHNMMTLTNCAIVNNVASAGAGGINDGGFDTFTNCTIAGNTTSGIGGGIYNTAISQLTLTACTIAGNTALLGGGGIAWAGGAVTANNCTFSGNSADSGSGGAILMLNAIQLGTLELTSGTLSQNSAADAGGLDIGNSFISVSMRNTIVAGNQAADNVADVQGAVFSFGHNLIGQVDGSTGWQPSDLTGTSNHPLDPRLGPLQDNGGPTATQAPFADSPAIDNGDPVLYRSLDQRGTSRNFDGFVARPDIGAVEAENAVSLRLIAPEHVGVGQPFALTVLALDQWGNIATTYAGTVHFDTTDLGGVLPPDYTFATGDQGVQTFAVTLTTPGSQSIRVNDVNDPSITQTVTVVVDGAPDPTVAFRDLIAWEFDGSSWHRRRN
jgi:hypothetical protein